MMFVGSFTPTAAALAAMKENALVACEPIWWRFRVEDPCAGKPHRDLREV